MYGSRQRELRDDKWPRLSEQRQGSPGMVRLKWSGEFIRFDNLTNQTGGF